MEDVPQVRTFADERWTVSAWRGACTAAAERAARPRGGWALMPEEAVDLMLTLQAAAIIVLGSEDAAEQFIRSHVRPK
jgi:hypothetical protein